jgi:hypothetical protein
MTLGNVLSMTGVVGIIAKIFVGVMWFSLTVFILCVMEVRGFVRFASGLALMLVVPGPVSVLARTPFTLG